NAEGQLVTANGYFLEPAITVPSNATSLTIGRDGIVSASLPGTAAPQQLGQLQLASFVNPTGLEPVGENLFRESMASGTPTIGNPSEDERGALVQHSLETSNVNVVEEMVNMIETQRAYEMTSKAISTTDQMLAFVTNNL
ncbi:MAG: flagellar hook-basal body complex protein, partial [Methylothermaceae bacterium]|nr:flagellar hook-basal body complex protein [Methylothermaceae bacterium]